MSYAVINIGQLFFLLNNFIISIIKRFIKQTTERKYTCMNKKYFK